jgi:hypothetical protein
MAVDLGVGEQEALTMATAVWLRCQGLSRKMAVEEDGCAAGVGGMIGCLPGKWAYCPRKGVTLESNLIDCAHSRSIQ